MARLVLAGDGPQRLQLEHLAADLGIADTVEFAGVVGDLRALFASAHSFVLASRYEGMSNALLEAMAAGMPCVATRVSGSEDVIIGGQSGLLVPPEDSGALACALMAILMDHELARSLGHEARARVVRVFDQHRVLDEYTQLYSSLVRHGNTRSRWAQGRSRVAPRARSATPRSAASADRVSRSD